MDTPFPPPLSQWQHGPVRLWLHPHPHPPRRSGEPISRQRLAEVLGGDPAGLGIHRDARGRPTLEAPFDSHDVNWSHSGDVLMVAFARNARVGVDVERLRPRPRAMALAERFFHASEAQWLAGQPASQREQDFTRLWCAKEAVLKAHGHGLSFGLDKLVFQTGDSGLQLMCCDAELGPVNAWQLREWQPLPGYRAAVAWRPHRR